MATARLSEDYVELECDSTVIDSWTSYSATSDLFTPADRCRLSIGVGTSNARDLRRSIADAQDLLAPSVSSIKGHGKEVKLWVNAGGKRALQGVYVVDGYEIDNDADSGTTFSVNLRDRALYLIGSAASPALYENGDSLISVARRAVKPWPQLQVTADHVAARDLRQARVSKDKLRKLQDKAKSWGIPPRLMSEKIAASIDHGTITFEDFAGAQAGGIGSTFSAPSTFPYTDKFTRSKTERDVSPLFAPAISPLRVAAEYGIPYSGATGLSSLQIYALRVKDIRPQSGETVWEYLDRHARRNGLLMSVTPDGKLLFCGLQYDQQPSHTLTRRIDGDRTQNNIIAGGYRLDISDVASEVIVYGRVKGNDVTRSAFKGRAVASDKDIARVPYLKTLVLHDNSLKSQADAQHRAEFELAKGRQGSQVVEVVVRGHSLNGVVYAPDTVLALEDQTSGLSGAWYVVARTFSRSARQGPTTSLKLVPKGAIQLSREAA